MWNEHVRSWSRVVRTATTPLLIAALLAAVASAAAPAPTPARPAGTSGSAKKGPAVQELRTRLDLKEPFNAGRGKVRIVAFFSPSCGHCIANAQGLQQLLDKLDTPDIDVYAVWLKILSSDSLVAAQHATTVLHDPRVHHYWDPNRALNAQLLDAITFDVQVRLYNVVLLYDRNAVWDSRLPRPGFWMHEFHGAPGPRWETIGFGAQIAKALDGQPLDTPTVP